MKINVSTLFVSRWAFTSCTMMRLEFRDLSSQQRFVGLIELGKYSAVKKLGVLCSLHFLPKGGGIKVGEITCYVSFQNILCITISECLKASFPAVLLTWLFWGVFCFILTLFWPISYHSTLNTRMSGSSVKLICDLWLMDLAQGIASSLFRRPSLLHNMQYFY